MKAFFVTGGLGYIGSHFIESLLRTYTACTTPIRVLIYDEAIKPHVIQVLGKLAFEGMHSLEFIQGDILDRVKLDRVFSSVGPIHAVAHFAGKISVAESVLKTEFYFEQNTQGTETLLRVMKVHQIHKLVFSSTAAVYESRPEHLAELTETDPLKPNNPYGESKLRAEKLIEAWTRSGQGSAIVFRYFNAAGASLGANLGEEHEPETHLIPLLIRALKDPASPPLQLYGNDYPTRDGTCIRDYIHVSDLAEAHVMALQYLENQGLGYFEVLNLGTSRGLSVKEVIEEAARIMSLEPRYVVADRRPGDAIVLIASHERAKKVLGWEPKLGLKEILKSAIDFEIRSKTHL